MKTGIALLLVFVFGCAPQGLTGFSTIDSSCDLCIVEGELNGKKTHFLLDTGASITTLDKNQSKAYSFSVPDRSVMDVGGFTNTKGSMSEALGVRSIRINGIEIADAGVYSTDMDQLVNFIENCSKKRISGIIGVPILKKHRLVIDLSSDKIYRSGEQ